MTYATPSDARWREHHARRLKVERLRRLRAALVYAAAFVSGVIVGVWWG